MNATSVMASFGCVSHVTDDASTNIRGALTLEFLITEYIMKERVLGATGSPPFELDTEHGREDGQVTSFKRKARTLTVRVGATELEIFIIKKLRLEVRVQGLLYRMMKFCIMC